MLFNSLTFLLFLPIVFVCYWLLRGNRKWQNAFTLVASYVFYGWWDWRFVFLIAGVSLMTYGVGQWMGHLDDGSDTGKARRKQRIALITGIVANLLVLSVFKYLNFFIENFTLLLQSLGLHADVVTLKIVLPVGISFYTLQAIGYLIDVYKRKIKASNDVIAFMAFIAFFPQLVAGPIERATTLYPQFLRDRHFSFEAAREGMQLMLWGFFKKIVVADGAAMVVNRVWNGIDSYSPMSLAIAAVMFSFQVYGDFSGYSDIAIGTARLFGMRLSRNFNIPFFSRTFPEIWRRWHITLMSWFIDYVYIPLGGNRCSTGRHLFNAFMVFFLSGLWHGASWTFIAWGVFNFIICIPWMILRHMRGKHPQHDYNVVVRVGQRIVAFALFTFTVIFFRSSTIDQAWQFLGHLFTGSGGMNLRGLLLMNTLEAAAAVVVMMTLEWRNRNRISPLQFKSTALTRVGYVVIAVWTFTLFTVSRDFIYFQF